ncbi:hypothetical protein R6258_05675 [Halomonas sp. HP20-15]|uniref:hypothetical protein n=1 Tax=Halomonas sp. HP20-15 TaxID=3085901 RepID=UPI0029822D87|nr:hypothetical protein [Halomonas sp. HP20-15]MDW5376404.1 hypothetical protein [Halomonas sp. HP20-15]
MTLPLQLVQTLQNAEPKEAWAAIFDYSWEICSQSLDQGPAVAEVLSRDRSLADLDHYLATAGWDLWSHFEQAAPRTSQELAAWWASHSPGRAILILDAFSMREVPWILHQAEARGFSVHQARSTGSELPPDTTPFAKALGFGQRSALGNNGARSARFPGARTESVDIAWSDCAALIGSEPDWIFWHHWPDHRLHDHDDPGKGLQTLTKEVAKHLAGDAFWSLVGRLATGRRLIITADHGYAASGQFIDSNGEQSDYLKGHYKSGRSIPGDAPAGDWVPPIDMAIDSEHGRHLYVNGRRKWKSQGGYPTLAHGGLSVLEVTVPFIELSRQK